MATSNGQRVAAFALAALFFLTSVGATAYIIWEINRDDGVLIPQTEEEKAESAALEEQRAADAADAADESQACGAGTIASVEPRALPSVTTAEVPVSELQSVDVKVGEGEEVQPGDCVGALYYGTLASNGEKFDGNYESGQPIEFSLTGVIQGWTEGIPGMKVGGVRRLVIPAEKAYGSQSTGGIPANSDLIFEVEIVSTRRVE